MKTERQTALTLGLYVLITIVAFNVLSAVFEFPDILRQPISERFLLFGKNQSIIIPAYYFFAMTGVLQIVFSIQLFKINGLNHANAAIGLVFGILAGLMQTLGYIRWVVAIPYLASVNQGYDVAIFEGVLNSYLGMSVGEHLGNLFLAIWLIFSAILMKESNQFDGRLRYMALVAGILMLLVAFESVHAVFSIFGLLTVGVWGIIIVWMILMAYSLMVKKDQPVIINRYVWMITLIFWLLNVVPAYI